ncbi:MULTISPECIES: ParB/RepB/Spo0J family partition protein [Streptomyces]|uniref:ParB/RepB/Spo0J family partition protein n=1 Tax=Streptomyces TaxID=1883 RepID=UPI00240D9BAF|nr:MULTISPECIES: ParB/RepB/Spo0J family partition protein [Streptomyces]WFB86819.1 ParB/RepB/Spo0J family partition protein [Streptomyces olivaceus]WGK46417.1 ParB/RepB/Spo0J family partition protein [Streptomyces sp. B146]
MLREFPPPPRAAEFSEKIKKKVQEAKESGGTRETVRVDWNEQQAHVEVIDLPLSGLYLNPGTHRIRAQRSHNAKSDAALDEDPWTSASQDYLSFLLQASPTDPSTRDPDFDKLKESLEQFGQNDPGLVTHQGVLVNGNTRAVALRLLGVQTMRVGVLPESFTWADINAVELSLQLRMDHRRDYTYINRLLAMEEQASLGRTPEQIAKDFRIQVKTYHQERWILSTIKELIDRSKSGGGVALRLVDWEGAQERLKELHRLYVKLENVDRDQAEILKEWRLAAILLDFSKTDVRHIDEDFLKEDYLSQALPAPFKGEASPADESAVSIPGLGMTVPGASSAVSDARALNDQLLRAAAAVRTTGAGVADSDKAKEQGVLDDARKAFDEAIEVAGRSARLRKRKQLAPTRLAEASASIDQCVMDLVQARTSRSLDEEVFDEAVLKLRGSLRKLAQQAGRGLPNPGDGVAWLLRAASAEDTR